VGTQEGTGKGRSLASLGMTFFCLARHLEIRRNWKPKSPHATAACGAPTFGEPVGGEESFLLGIRLFAGIVAESGWDILEIG
jgi:hypothetical protein